MDTRIKHSAGLDCAAADDLFLRFLHWAERSPHRLAIGDGDGSWSYSGLVGEVGRLGDLLPGATLRRASMVGVLLPEGVPTVTGVLAALARGHGAVCFEAGRSSKQRAARFETARVDYVLTNRELRDLLPPDLRCPVLLVEDAPDFPIASWVPRRTQLLSLAFERTPAGRVEAHVLTHRLLAAEVDRVARETGLNHHDHMDGPTACESAQFLPLVFSALCLGAQLTFVPPSVRHSEAYAEWVKARQITYSTLTPEPWRHLLSGLKPGEKIASFRFLELNGARFHPRDIAMMRQHLPPDALVQNSIGHPALGTFLRARCRAWQVSVNSLLTMEPVPGKGLVLEPAEAHADDGEVTLQTSLRSPGLWLGPTLSTIESPDPSVVMRTGCVARMLEDGRIRFLGHCEDYVTIHGRRVNLRQVERWIALQPGVEESAVMATGLGRSELELVAFVVLRPRGVNSAENLHRAALRELGEAQRPIEWVEVAALPRLFSGELDHPALEQHLRAQQAHALSREPDEIDWLRSVWTRLLGRADFGVHDSFFTVGGDSQAAADLAHVLARKTGRRVTPDLFWEHSTIAELAVWMEVQAQSAVEALPVFREADPAGHVILVPPFRGGVEVFEHLVPHLALRSHVHCLDYGAWACLPESASPETLAAHAVGSIHPQWSKTSLSIIGYGGGTRVAWETAQMLLRQERPAVNLVLLGPLDNVDRLEPIACPVTSVRAVQPRWRFWERTEKPAEITYCRNAARLCPIKASPDAMLRPEHAAETASVLRKLLSLA